MTKLLLAAAAAALIAAPAFAAPAVSTDADTQAEAATRTVSAQGVNFSDRAQVKAFYGKLHLAAASVCDAGSPIPRAFATDARCVRDVVARAVKAADQPVLTAMYNASPDADARAFAGNDQ